MLLKFNLKAIKSRQKPTPSKTTRHSSTARMPKKQASQRPSLATLNQPQGL
jgi:hypothetical protein